MMRNIKRRIILMEARCAMNNSLAPCHDAFWRVRQTLYDELADVHRVRGETTDFGSYRSEFCFRKAVRSLRDRIDIGVITREDGVVIESLSSSDLYQMGMSAERVIGLFAKIHDDY